MARPARALPFAIVAGGLALLHFVDIPADPAIRLCPFYWLTHLPCPLCGLTRGMAALMKGRWETALRFHALTPLALVILGVWAAAPLLGRRVALPWRGITAAFAIYGIARMGAVLFW